MVGLERPQGQPRIFTHPANTNPPSMFDPDITVEGEEPVQADMGGDACCIDAKNKWIEGLREIFGDDYSAPHHAEEIFQEVAPFHQVEVIAASAHPDSPNGEIYRSYEEMSCEEFRDAIEQFAGGRPGPFYNANVGNRRNPTSEHYLAKRILEEWDMCEAKSTFGDNMDIYASADTPFLAVWDAIIKDDITDRPMNDFEIRRPTEDGSGDFLGHYRPWDGKALTFLEPFAQGSGWRPLPKPESGSKWEREPPREGSEVSVGPLVEDAEGRRIPALEPKRDRVLGMDILDTAMHEAGHQATYDEIHAAINAAKHAQQDFDWGEWGRNIENDPLYPAQWLSGQKREAQANWRKENPTETRWDRIVPSYQSMAGLLLDNPDALRAWLKGSAEDLAIGAGVNTERDFSDSGDELAAYITEFPHHPGYTRGKWLMHSHVPQALKRKYLQAVERAQKKAGVQEPIEGKSLAGQISPNLGWGKRTRNLRQIMGNPPESRDSPESKRLLMPAKERIQQNMINAAIGQAYSILTTAGDFQMDPVAGRQEQHATRVKQATKFAKPLIDAIKRHFKTNDGQGQTIKDLPEDVRMELGRMQLRQHLANMVAQQNDLAIDESYVSPKKAFDYERLNSLLDEKMKDFGERPHYVDSRFDYSGYVDEDEHARDSAAYEAYKDKQEEMRQEIINELMASGNYQAYTGRDSPFKQRGWGNDEKEGAIEIPRDYRQAFERWANAQGIEFNPHIWGVENYVKLKGPVQTGVKRKRVPKPKALYDPVTRAIADAFMLSQYEAHLDDSYANPLQLEQKDPEYKGSKWGGELFSGEVGSEYGIKGYYNLGHDYVDTTKRSPRDFRDYLNWEENRVPLNWLLGKVAQKRLDDIADRKRKENDERIRREREARGDD